MAERVPKRKTEKTDDVPAAPDSGGRGTFPGRKGHPEHSLGKTSPDVRFPGDRRRGFRHRDWPGFGDNFLVPRRQFGGKTVNLFRQLVKNISISNESQGKRFLIFRDTWIIIFVNPAKSAMFYMENL